MDKKFILFGALALILVIGANVGASFFITQYLIEQREVEIAQAELEQEEGVEEVDTRPPIYIELKPFVINYVQGEALRYLQMTVQFMSREQLIVDEVQNATPQIRNALILLLSSQSYEELATREGKETLRTMIHDEVNNILAHEEGIESVFLTSFVMQ